MLGDVSTSFGRLVAVLLIGLFIAASGAPCRASPATALSVSALDPCRQVQAPASECAQINCKTFAVPAAPFVNALSPATSVQFHDVVKKAGYREVRPPLPPPRQSMS
jgi:hypothetical protein